jgi:endonuclease/exonuclease/phosphatase family metal-dependent hydrolase
MAAADGPQIVAGDFNASRDHVLVPRTATVHMARAIPVPRTDHHGVLADIEFT